METNPTGRFRQNEAECEENERNYYGFRKVILRYDGESRSCKRCQHASWNWGWDIKWNRPDIFSITCYHPKLQEYDIAECPAVKEGEGWETKLFDANNWNELEQLLKDEGLWVFDETITDKVGEPDRPKAKVVRAIMTHPQLKNGGRLSEEALIKWIIKRINYRKSKKTIIRYIEFMTEKLKLLKAKYDSKDDKLYFQLVTENRL